jgi:hypothetical protein
MARRVLLVDDNRLVLEVLSSMLEASGCDVIGEESGEAALQFSCLQVAAARSAQAAGETSLPIARLRSMPSSEEYRKRAKDARQEANVCRNEWERQRLLTIADQCERIAAYKDLTGVRSRVQDGPAISKSQQR